MHRGAFAAFIAVVHCTNTLPVFTVGKVPADTTDRTTACPTSPAPANVLAIPYNSATAPFTLTTVNIAGSTQLQKQVGRLLGNEVTGLTVRLGGLRTNPTAAADCSTGSFVGAPATLSQRDNNKYSFALDATHICGLASNGLSSGLATATACTATQWNNLNAAPVLLQPGSYRPLCAAGPTGQEFLGVWVTAQYNCDADAACDVSVRRGTGHSLLQSRYNALSTTEQAIDAAQTKCVVSTTELAVGTCYNNNKMAVCGARPYDPTLYLCCGDGVLTQRCAAGGVAQKCTCRNNAAGSATTADGALGCPGSETCCVGSKYDEFAAVLNTGVCVDNTVTKCCSSGETYDVANQQCCALTGVTSLQEACPCGADADCAQPASEGNYRRMRCCQQTAPAVTSTDGFCSKYVNYPAGVAAASDVRCRGQCYDPYFATCCNGALCRREFEKCCNNTCYNVYTQSCALGKINPTTPANNWEYGVWHERATSIESMNLIRAWWVFLLPTLLLACALGGLAIALVFSSASRLAFSAVESFMRGVAVVGTLACVPLFFSPAYKYGAVAAMTFIFLILAASARVRWISIAAVAVCVLTLGYFIDPFLGNDYLTLASDRTVANGRPDPQSGGVFHSVGRSFRSAANYWAGTNPCLDFYNGYFQYDAALQDEQRFKNPVRQSFGYCSRDWTLAVLIFSGLVVVFLLLQLILSLLCLLLRYRKQAQESELTGLGLVGLN